MLSPMCNTTGMPTVVLWLAQICSLFVRMCFVVSTPACRKFPATLLDPHIVSADGRVQEGTLGVADLAMFS